MLNRTILTLLMLTTAFLLVPSGLAGHDPYEEWEEPHESGWFNYHYHATYSSNGWEVVMDHCDAKNYLNLDEGVFDDPGSHLDEGLDGFSTGLFIQDRYGDQGVNGMTDDNGAGTWIYQESNGIRGLQIGDSGDPFASECPNADTLIFGKERLDASYSPTVEVSDHLGAEVLTTPESMG